MKKSTVASQTQTEESKAEVSKNKIDKILEERENLLMQDENESRVITNARREVLRQLQQFNAKSIDMNAIKENLDIIHDRQGSNGYFVVDNNRNKVSIVDILNKYKHVRGKHTERHKIVDEVTKIMGEQIKIENKGHIEGMHRRDEFIKQWDKLHGNSPASDIER